MIDQPGGGRDVEEWIGETPNSVPPPRVKIRVFERHGRRCVHCTRPLRVGDKWDTDHLIALINNGQNRESNLGPACEYCHPEKTKRDVATKSKTAKIVKKAYLPKGGKKKIEGRGFQTNRDGAFQQKMDGSIVKRGKKR
jgi:5-methylcytosine-specific restriction protein A